MTITIKIATGNAAFEGDVNPELYCIFKKLTERISEGGTHYLNGSVQDSNGNTVGSVKVTGR
jgi:hypothetical protein